MSDAKSTKSGGIGCLTVPSPDIPDDTVKARVKIPLTVGTLIINVQSFSARSVKNKISLPVGKLVKGL